MLTRFVLAAALLAAVSSGALADAAARGKDLYTQTCIACHLPEGQGIDKVNPPLAKSDWVTGDADRLIRVVLHGVQGAITVNDQPYFGLMPGHAPMLDDNQVADVLTYVRASFGNKAAPIDPKRVAAVRAAYPGQTTPWTNDELKAPVPNVAVTPTPADTDKPLLADLAYSYYEGKWLKLPNFASLKPAATGKLPNGLITLEPAKRRDSFAMVYKATLNVPVAGEYAFNLSSDDGSRLIIDGKTVVDNDGVHGNSAKAGKIKLAAGAHEFETHYFNALGPNALQLVVSGPKIGTRALTPGSPKSNQNDDPRFYLLASDRPLVVRANLPEAPSRSIAVGLLNGINFVFDPETCTVRYAWFGQFLDAGPNRGHGRGRGGAPCKLLGERFNVGNTNVPLRVGANDPEIQFLGYSRTGDAPTFIYTVTSYRVKHTIRGATGGLGIVHTFEVESDPANNATFTVDPAGLKLTSSAGTWDGGTLTVPAKDAKRFTVTVLVDNK